MDNKNSINDIWSKLDIVEIINGYVSLQGKKIIIV